MRVVRVVYQRDDDGWWVAVVRGLRGCHTQGRSIRQARQRIREALELFVSNARTIRLLESIRLPAAVRRTLARHDAARRGIERARLRARPRTIEAARALTKDASLSVRDAGELLGLSHQRVQQLLRNRGR